MPVVDGEGREIDAFGPDHPDGLPIGFHVIHIRTPHASILVDSGFDDPDSAWGQEFAKSWFVRRTPGLGAALAALGESHDSITHIAITHAHFDHVAGLAMERGDGLTPRFPNAQVLINQAELEELDREGSTPADIRARVATVREAGLVVPVEDGHEIADGIVMKRTGGESPGHSVMVGKDWRFAALGDLFHYPFEVEHPEWMASWTDREGMRKGREEVLAAAAAAGGTLIFSHHPFPPWGIVERHGDGFRWKPDALATGS